MIVDCPQCNAKVIWQASSLYRPFCSKRCQLIDLGEWSNEEHVITETPRQTTEKVPDIDIEDVEALLMQQGEDFFKS